MALIVRLLAWIPFGKADPSYVPYDYGTCSEFLERFPRRRCDGIKDCGTEEDEGNCSGCSVVKDRSFQCKHTTKCISMHLQCDGNKDCDDGSDEDNCGGCHVPGRSFQCGTTSQCIQERLKCDGDKDCRNGFDEISCENCGGVSGRFQCANSMKCVHEDLRCDGKDDCDDSSDEVACKKCDVYLQRYPNRACDGTVNCANKADERCATCPNDRSFKCGNTTKCISDDLVCDGEISCADGSDEEACESSNVNCKWSEWSEWSRCATCENPTKQRSRTVEVEAEYGGLDCIGSDTAETSCAGQGCPIDCGGLVEGRSGSFSSRSGYYARHADCRWLIQGSFDEKIRVNFTRVDLPDEDEETYDFIALYDGEVVESEPVETVQGRTLSPLVYETTSPQLTVRLKTNGEGASTSGFFVNFDMLPNH